MKLTASLHIGRRYAHHREVRDLAEAASMATLAYELNGACKRVRVRVATVTADGPKPACVITCEPA